MQKWSAFMMTASPSGASRRSSSSASVLTASSWICGRLMIQSARRAYLDRPIRLESALGSTPTHSRPMIGQKWCEQAERTVMGPTTSSSLSFSTLGNSVMSGAAR